MTKAKKKPTLGNYVKNFLDESGLSEALELTAQRVVHHALEALESREEESVDPDDPYVILGLQPDAPPEVVDAVYRALAKVHHPDLGGDEETFKRITEAYRRVRRE